MISIIEQLNDFFNINLQENPEEIFSVLKRIIPFNSGYIYFLNPKKLEYSHNACTNKFKIKTELKIKNTIFGSLEIQRDYEFSKDEKALFNACASIVSNLIKDIEITKIINMQVKVLQEGLKETTNAFDSAKAQNEVFANFSHELKTPLNSIISSSELLSEEIFGKLNPKQLEYVNDIRISALHLLSMINDILDMSKIEANSMQLNRTEFNLSSVADEVCNIIKPVAVKKNINIEKKYSGEDIILADRQKLQQIIFNLVSNAIKYTPSGGHVTISICKDKNCIVISVKDNGIGIALKYHKKIFEKFVQFGSEKNSNGLGLTITNELVKLHKGKIFVRSKKGEGAEFIVNLPLRT